MVRAHRDSSGTCEWIDIRPDRSLDWGQVRFVLLVMAIPPVLIGAGFALAGAWMILPFSGLELVAVWAALWAVALAGEQREVLRFEPDWVTLEKGRYFPLRRHRFRRQWAHFDLESSDHPWYGPRLFLRQQARSEELGSFLSEEGKRELVTLLRRVVSEYPDGGEAGPH